MSSFFGNPAINRVATLDPWLCVPLSRAVCLYRKEVRAMFAQLTCQHNVAQSLQQVMTKKATVSLKAVECL
jgi:hypothetical protein